MGQDGSAPELVLACVVLPVATEQFAAPAPGEAYTLMFGFTKPRSRGAIRLAAADPEVPPLIDPNYLAEDYDRRAYLDALEMARQVGGATALDDWRAAELLPCSAIQSRTQKLAFLEKAAFTHHHPVGTCRMGIDGAAVVGPDPESPWRGGAPCLRRLRHPVHHHGTGQCRGDRHRRADERSASLMFTVVRDCPK